MSASETNNNSDLVSFTIKVSGQAIPDTILVSSINVLKQFNVPSHAEITILSGNILDQDSLDVDSNLFDNGKTIGIEIGYNGQNTLVFSGVVSGQSLSINAETGTRFKINCIDTNFIETPDAIDLIDADNTSSTPSMVATYGINIYELTATINKYNQSNVFGSFKTQGTSLVEPNNLIELTGVSEKFNGNHLVNKINHTMSEGNWFSEIFFG